MIIAHFRRAFGAPSETFITDPILRLSSRGVSNPLFTLLSLDPASPIPHTAMARARGDRGRAVEQRSRHLPSFVSKLDFLGWPVARRWLRHRLVDAQPDVLISHFGPDGCLAAPVARRLGIPHVVFFYGYDVNLTTASRPNIWSRLYPRLFRSADSLCTTSDYLARRLHALGAPADKQTAIYVGIDTNAFSYSNPVERFDGRVVRLLHVGRLDAGESFGPAGAVVAGDVLGAVGAERLGRSTLQTGERFCHGSHGVDHRRFEGRAGIHQGADALAVAVAHGGVELAKGFLWRRGGPG